MDEDDDGDGWNGPVPGFLAKPIGR
jgi:hypothetical protein